MDLRHVPKLLPELKVGMIIETKGKGLSHFIASTSEKLCYLGHMPKRQLHKKYIQVV